MKVLLFDTDSYELICAELICANLDVSDGLDGVKFTEHESKFDELAKFIKLLSPTESKLRDFKSLIKFRGVWNSPL